jgi:hypothetical protein
MIKLFLILIVAIFIVGAVTLLTDPQGFIDTFIGGLKAILNALGGVFG